MDLIIVESPTKAKTLSRFLGDDYQIEASMGHIRDLPESKLGVDVTSDFAPEYVVPAKKKEKVAELKKAAAKAGTVILATDPDREGEAIAFHLAELIREGRRSKDGISRITFHEITQSAVKDALSHPGTIDMQLVNSQQARRVLDRLVGYKLSPLLWRKVRRGLSAGRVQTVAVRLIVEREREITAFVPVEYWEIIATLKADRGEFEAELLKIDGKKAEIGNKEQADNVVLDLEKARFEVADITEKELRRSPYPPFTTSTLQQAAANLFGWSAKRTMQVAQNLYEQGRITYHRTDSLNLAAEAVQKVRGYIGSEFGEKYLPGSPRFYKTKSKVAQEAHEAIRPTAVESLQLGSTDHSDRDQGRLYELIWRKFVACQMAEAVYQQTAVDVRGISQVEYLLRANGSKQLFDGWMKLFSKASNDSEASDASNGSDNGGTNKELPEMTVGEVLELLKLLPSQHFTEPPPRYTEASLIKTLEEYGIGRPSTYAPIISTIQERQYVEKVEKKFQPTSLGFAVNDFLISNFPSLFDFQFTARMEDNLDEIATGEKQWVPVIREFYDPFNELLGKVTETAGRVKVEVEETNEKCPNDGSPLVVRIGRFGKFLACSKFPECKFTKPFQQKLNMKCPKCGEGEIVVKRTKSRKSFYGCSRYPDCDFASWTKPKLEQKSSSEGQNVPLDS